MTAGKGKKLQTARKWHRPPLSQEEFASLLGVSRSALASYETGRNPVPDSVLLAAAAMCRIPLEWFLDGQDSAPPADHREPPNAAFVDDRITVQAFTTTAAIRSWRGALAGFNGEDCYFEEDGTYEVPVAFLVGGIAKIDLHDVVRVSGMSMAPRILSGDRVIVYRDQTLIRNAIVLATSPAGKVYLKVLRHRNERWELDSIGNGDHFPDLGGWQVHGYAVTIIRSDDEEPGPNVEWRSGKPLKA